MTSNFFDSNVGRVRERITAVELFDMFAQRLNRLAIEEYGAVHAEKNPIARHMAEIKLNQAAHVMQQYSLFARELFGFTELAKDKAREVVGWSEIAEELEHNVAQELGSATQGVPHYMILRNGVEEAFGTPVEGIKPSAAIVALCTHMRGIFDKSAPYVLGATYAIEATSIPELQIIRRLICTVCGGAVPPTLKYFLDMHLDEWEPEHEAAMRGTIAKCLSTVEYEPFEAGFRAVMEAMDIWWDDLAAEMRLYN
jgi:hypothetical protein